MRPLLSVKVVGMAFTKYWYIAVWLTLITPRRALNGFFCCYGSQDGDAATRIGVPSERLWIVCVTFSVE